jgi:hypothetical protein
MSELSAMPLSALVKTHERCDKCGVLVPTHFLSCPSCLGLVCRPGLGVFRWQLPARWKGSAIVFGPPLRSVVRGGFGYEANTEALKTAR